MAKRGRKKAKDDKGYLDSNKDAFTDYKVIDGNKITMKGVSGKIYAIPVDSKGNAGKGRLMSPNEEHEFEGATQIIELPESAIAQAGKQVGLTNTAPTLINKALPHVAGLGNSIMNLAEGIGGHVRENINADKEWWNENFGGENWRRLGETPSEGGAYDNEKNDWTGGVGRYTTGDNGAHLVPNLGEKGIFYTPFQPEVGLRQGIFDTPFEPETSATGDTIPSTELEEGAYDPSMELGGEDYSKYMSDIKAVGNKGESIETDPVVATSDQEEVEPTEQIRFNNLYGGVDLTSASNILGKSFGYEGEQKGANAARGIGSGLKLLAGLGRNIMSGYGQEKRNNYLMKEDREKQKSAMKKPISAQKGGLAKKDLDAINEATGIQFDADVANNIFQKTPPRTTTQYPEIDFGRYKDVGYFETGEIQNGKRVIYNTDKNPMNYDDNRRNALAYLRELNGDNFEFKYRDSQARRPQINPAIVSRKKGGDVKPADLMSGAYVTGDDTVTPNVNVEEGEHVKNNETGRVAEVAGKKHTQGGENMNLDGAVLSDHNKIGGKLAKEYRDEFDINVKAKDTFATAMDKVLKKTGYKSLTDEMSKYIEKTEKEQEKAKEIDSEATTGLNMQFLSGKINELNKQIEPLEEMKSQVFERFFTDQQAAKSPEEIKEENEGMEAATGKSMEAVIARPKHISDEQWKVAQEIYDAAVKMGDKFPELTVSQAALESGWFKKQAGKNNYFGQKGTKSQDTSDVATHEYINGKKVNIVDGFRNYETIEDAVADRMRLWGSRYQEADTLEDAVGIILGADGKSAYATDPEYASKVTSIATNLVGEGKGLGEVPNELRGTGDRPVYTGTPAPENRFPEVDTTEKSDFDGDPNDPTFQRWFYQTYGGENPTRPAMANTPHGIIPTENPAEITSNAETRVISEEERARRAALESAEQGEAESGEERTDNTRYQTPLLPDQTPLPPSSLRLTDLQQVSPREAEAKLISPDTQIEEINRQFLAAKRSLDNLPASERVAALAKLQSQTQQSINQVMAATNQQNAQIKGQTEQFNTQTQNQAEASNINLAKQYERETLTAVDNTNQEINNWFNRIQENNMGNYLTVQELNLINQKASDFQYNANGEVEQTGKGLSKKDIDTQAASALNMTLSEYQDLVKKRAKANKRGRKN